MSNNTFKDRHVMITGGTGALGSAVTKRFLDAGATCHVTWIEQREIERFALGKAVSLHQLDATDESAVSKLYASLPGLWASVHLIGGFAMAPIEKTTRADMQKMFEMNTMTCILCCREAVRRIRSGKSPDGGRIVNVAARPAVQPAGGMIAYATSKASVASITQCLADELKNDGILVNAVLPSIMDTPSNRKSLPDADFDKWPKVEQVAEAIAFLASPQNALTSGALLPVYGRA